MKKLYCLPLAILVFASCNFSDERSVAKPVPLTPEALVASATTTTRTPVRVVDSTQPGALFSTPAPLNTARPAAPVITAAATTPVGTAATAGAAAGRLNPPHGQPGHRCDIAVGAPLDSPPAQPVAATPAPIKKGMNPPHGQPGHRCDIPVGAPLNSPVATTANKPAATTPATTVAPGMNPPHGQPGHRCDIPVGAPLNSVAGKAVATDSTRTPSPLQPADGKAQPTPAPAKDSAAPVIPPKG